MKTSYFEMLNYVAPRQVISDWPVSPDCYDVEYGERSFRHSLAQAEFAEQVGFDWISLSEHHYTTSMVPNPALAACAVAARLRKAKIAMVGHTLPLNNPVRVAEELASLDTLTNGRLIVGFLRGTPNEYQTYTVNPAETRDLTVESMELILKAWTEPHPFGWEGRHYRYRTVAVWPRPVQQPYPRCYVLGASTDTADFAAHHHMGIGLAYAPFNVVADRLNYYRERCAEAGWEPSADDMLYRASISIAESDEEAQRESRRWLHDNLNLAMRHGIDEAVEQLDPTPGRNMARMGSLCLARFVGSPDAIVSQIEQCREECGVGIIDFGFEAPGLEHSKVMRMIELFGNSVMPRIRDL